MNVLVTKFMAARFNSYSDVERMYGGLDVNAETFRKIAESYPEHTFYYAGASDLSKSDIDIPQNAQMNIVLDQPITVTSNTPY